MLWLATDQGLNRFDGINNSVFRSNPFITTALKGNRVWHVEDYAVDTLVVISDNAFHLFTPKNYSFARFDIESRPTTIYRDGIEFWITTLDKGIYRFDKNQKLHHFKFDPLNPFSIATSEFKSTTGTKFATDNQGKVWLATEKGLCSIDKDSGFVSRYFQSNTNNKLLSNRVNSVYFYNDVLHIGTDNGLNYLNTQSMEFSSEETLNGISINNIDESSGSVLVFSDNGIFKINQDSALSFSKQVFNQMIKGNLGNIYWSKNESEFFINGKYENLVHEITSVTNTKNGGYLISTKNGIYLVDGKESGVFESAQRLNRGDNMTFKTLYSFKDFVKFSTIIDINKIRDYAIFKDTIWYTNEDGIMYSFINNKVTQHVYNSRDPNSFPNNISTVEIFDGFLWVGSIESGLFKYNLVDLTLIKHYQFNINDPNSLQTSFITCAFVDLNNQLWIGSGGDGLFKYQKSYDGFLKYDSGSGLKSEIINSLYGYEEFLLITTNRGVNYLRNGENLFKSLDSQDGLEISDFSNIEFFDKESKLYLKNDKQIYGIDFELIDYSAYQYKPLVNLIAGIDSKNNRFNIEFSNDKATIPHNITSIEIGVSTPSLYKADQNIFSYNFSSKGNNPLISKKSGEVITIPKTGFRDKVLELGDERKEIVHSTIEFDYIPPWYFTWWAITSYAILAFGAIYLFTTFRAKRLQQQLEESRKSEELEEARNLQLQLLAKKVPEMKNVEVETYIRTATEVGGDYYDFFELDDGTLIAACGDATGHGATSGMMVSITKAGLKGIQKRSPNEMLTDLNNIVKSVEIGRIRMSLNLLEFKNGHVNISSAAMPPVYHYSKKTDSVNEIELVGTPLGSFYDEEFDRYQVDFEDGDALVLMSDGLPEAPNHDGEMLDYPAVKECIKANGSKSASGIKDSLIELSDNWLDGIQNPDDSTLVIFKKHNTGEIANA